MEIEHANLCCLDLDTFFVSVERLLDPSLEGKAVVVGGARGGRGVVTAASYEIRAYGVRSGMPMGEASRLAPPDAIFLPTRHGTYSQYAKRVREVLERYSPEVRTASIDEFYIDFGGCERLYRQPGDADADATIERVVRAMCAAIRGETGLPASAGIGGSRIIAKIASGRAKPAGVLLVHRGGEREFLLPLPVRKFPGIGPKAEARLQRCGIATLADLVGLPNGPLRRRFTRMVGAVEREMRGAGTSGLCRERPAFLEYDPDGLHVGSISNERTFFSELGSEEQVLAQLLGLTERVCWRARKRGIRARTITLKLRYADFHTITRSRTGSPANDEGYVMRRITELFRQAYVAERARRGPRRVRLVGIALSNLVGDEEPRQLGLPLTPARPVAAAPVGAAMDEVRLRFGYDAVHLAMSRGSARSASRNRSLAEER